MIVTLDFIQELREKTKVGDRISFMLEISEHVAKKPRIYKVKVKGVVLSKYPHIFELDDGHCYRWSDYAIGKEY